jgi:hypothetical protein
MGALISPDYLGKYFAENVNYMFDFTHNIWYIFLHETAKSMGGWARSQQRARTPIKLRKDIAMTTAPSRGHRPILSIISIISMAVFGHERVIAQTRERFI